MLDEKTNSYHWLPAFCRCCCCVFAFFSPLALILRFARRKCDDNCDCDVIFCVWLVCQVPKHPTMLNGHYPIQKRGTTHLKRWTWHCDRCSLYRLTWPNSNFPVLNQFGRKQRQAITSTDGSKAYNLSRGLKHRLMGGSIIFVLNIFFRCISFQHFDSNAIDLLWDI